MVLYLILALYFGGLILTMSLLLRRDGIRSFR
jgi:hypothetical protein